MVHNNKHIQFPKNRMKISYEARSLYTVSYFALLANDVLIWYGQKKNSRLSVLALLYHEMLVREILSVTSGHNDQA